MFAAAASSASVTASSLGAVIDAVLAVAPPGSRYAAAMRRGVKLGGGDLDGDLDGDLGARTLAISTAAVPTEAVAG
jgi:hypothetical protein